MLLGGDAGGERDTHADFSNMSLQLQPMPDLDQQISKHSLGDPMHFCAQEDKKGFFAGRISLVSYK